jgi:hypothetical protein
MAFAEEKVPKASAEYELVQRIFLLNRAICFGNYPRFSPSDAWLCDPNVKNTLSLALALALQRLRDDESSSQRRTE